MRSALLALLASLFVAEAAGAVTVRVVPEALEVPLDRAVVVNVVADLDVPVLGFGFHLELSDLFPFAAFQEVGPDWIRLIPLESSVPINEGTIAGAAFPDGIVGEGVLLARVLVASGSSTGTSLLTVSITPGDPTEGFFLDPTGMAEVTIEGAEITVVPEPGTVLLLGAGLAWVSRRRRGRARR